MYVFTGSLRNLKNYMHITTPSTTLLGGVKDYISHIVVLLVTASYYEIWVHSFFTNPIHFGWKSQKTLVSSAMGFSTASVSSNKLAAFGSGRLTVAMGDECLELTPATAKSLELHKSRLHKKFGRVACWKKHPNHMGGHIIQKWKWCNRNSYDSLDEHLSRFHQCSWLGGHWYDRMLLEFSERLPLPPRRDLESNKVAGFQSWDSRTWALGFVSRKMPLCFHTDAKGTPTCQRESILKMGQRDPKISSLPLAWGEFWMNYCLAWVETSNEAHHIQSDFHIRRIPTAARWGACAAAAHICEAVWL